MTWPRLIEPMSRGYFPGPDDPSRPPQFSPRPFRVTVRRSQTRIAGGGFGDEPNVELIDGELIESCYRSPRHSGGIGVLAGELRDRLPKEWTVSQHGPVTMEDLDSEPEPNVTVLAGELENWMHDHPAPSGVLLAAEVADLSLGWCRGRKARLYAAAGLSAYWIVNLPERVLEVRTDPHVAANGSAGYRTLRTYTPDETATFELAGRSFSLPVAELLSRVGRTETVSG